MPKSKHRKKTGRTGTGDAIAMSSASAGDTPNREKTEKTKKASVGPIQFLRQVRDESQKITWTTRSETMVSTIMVLIMVALASVFFLIVDQVLRFIVPLILNINA
ncbi:preprotein translocase subunit SecE [Parvularcula sp. LCG005]|uniref:preprotein translocase subunit SecE n=1 Tax=Parvularcula sp. LCG005 TaxID=3078805 RepID=UPI0029426850|nr:preprotein translocase subunit SecE [Parvularcula sp. LCG005]WOI52286.1 preprotein translocase subunit SecE [Parvularcula sp. LCG005]